MMRWHGLLVAFCVLQPFAGSQPLEQLPDDSCASAEDCSVELRQLRARRVGDEAPTCASLENHGTFSSVKVGVGTPPQTFKLVADTGSDNLIVQSCICKESHACPADYGACFRGTGQSATFSVNETEAGVHSFVMSFGSGDILVVRASDEVTVGTAKAFMNNSLLLMVKQALKIGGPFEGILGLGRPHRDKPDMTPGFLKLAGIHRFSMCFNEEGPGVLGLNTPKFSPGLQSVGSLHWGLDFRGIGVGTNNAMVNMCQNKTPGMDSACGLIPDSGTTLITGPKDDIAKLYAGICDLWPRCKEMHAALVAEFRSMRRSGYGPPRYQRVRAMLEAGKPLSEAQLLEAEQKQGAMPLGMADKDMRTGDSHLPQAISKSSTLVLLMKHCYTWLGNSTDLNGELPELQFHVAGTAGYQETLVLDPNSYTFMTTAPIAHQVVEHLMGYLPIEVITVTQENVCMPGFSPMQYETLKNGPIWIMGTPLFYSYQVEYDREPEPPIMHFVKGGCGTCVDGQTQHHSTKLLQRKTASGMRKLSHPPVVKPLDPNFRI